MIVWIEQTRTLLVDWGGGSRCNISSICPVWCRSNTLAPTNNQGISPNPLRYSTWHRLPTRRSGARRHRLPAGVGGGGPEPSLESYLPELGITTRHNRMSGPRKNVWNKDAAPCVCTFSMRARRACMCFPSRSLTAVAAGCLALGSLQS